MEKEMDQFLENRQNHMMDNSMQHLNVASAGDGVVGGVQAEVSGVAGEILGGKYDEHHEEHDVGDDDELKYVEEVQQSEKQQQKQLQTLKNFGLDYDGTHESNELAVKEIHNNGSLLFGGDHHHQQQQHDLFNMGNGHDSNGHENINVNKDVGLLISTGFEEKVNLMGSEIDGFKNEGDFSISNITESVEGFIPQVDVKIEAKVEHQEMIDEEEPSSLATNTTNGTSSLSENVPPQAVVASQANAIDDFMANLENKENSDPLTPQRPNELDLEQAHSQLNPDAKEFVPSFGSNPATPTSPFATEVAQNDPVLSDIMEMQMYFGQAPSAVLRHLSGDDDFVAQSPRKGNGDNNMDAVSLPKELSEFEQEADKRPHELEPQDIDGFHQREEVMTPDQAIQQLPLDDVVTQDKEENQSTDSADFKASNFMDHGPETSVDPQADLDMKPTDLSFFLQGEDDVMKRAVYVASDEAIEDVLNSVQRIPTEIDSGNNSSIEESATESAANQLAGDKELLQVEEKEHVSHSPSTEEIEMNLQNTLNSSNKNIPQLPIDMDNANNIQEFTYMEQEQHLQEDQEQEQDKQLQAEELFEPKQQAETHFPQEDLRHEQQQQQFFQEDFKQDNHSDLESEQKHYEKEIQNFQEDLELGNHAEHDTHVDKQDLQGKIHEEQQFVEESLQLVEESQLNELQNDQQPTHDEQPSLSTEVAEESLLSNLSIANDNFLDKAIEIQEQQQEINESFSPFKITDQVSNTHAIESLNFDAPANQEESNINDVMTPSFTADEKHLLEETKEQNLLSMSGLEEKMSEMMLNNTDCNLSKAEKVAATTAIEDLTENLITTDEAIAQEEQYRHFVEPDQTFVDDSFNRHELECLQQEMDMEYNQQIATKSDLVQESIESPIEQQHQQQLETEMVAVEEPIIEAKEATATILTNEETEIVNAIKNEERQELPLCMVPETAPAECLVAPIVKNEEETTEKANKVEEEEVKTETIKEPEVDKLEAKEGETVKEEVVAADVPVEAAIVAVTAVAATATAAIAAKVAPSPTKTKSETEKKSLSKTTTTATKPKVAPTSAAKKPVEAAKKPIGLAAKPRTAPAKPAGTVADKKPIAKTTTTTASTAARKPLSATTTTASKLVTKTTTSTTTSAARTATAASKTTATSKPATAPRTFSSSTTTARKLATTNGPLAKSRPATAPAKPTTLGLSSTNGAPKTKPLSPRATLTSQVRKTAPAATAAKSPIKSTATNGVTKTATASSSTLASRTKTTTSTVSTTASKTFTARPAPKFTSSSSTTTTTTTTRRSTVGGSTTASTTTKTSSTPLRKSSPSKPATGKTPTKSTTTTGGSKPKTPVTKIDSPVAKPAPIRKPAVTNGELNGTVDKANIDLQAVQQNGDSSIPMQTEKQQQSFLEPRDEQMPVDLINA